MEVPVGSKRGIDSDGRQCSVAVLVAGSSGQQPGSN